MKRIQEYLKTDDVIGALELIIGTLNPLTVDHQVRVTGLACAIAAELHAPENMIEDVRVAAALHDIGELSVPTDILNKPGPLLPEEYDLVKTHPQSGAAYLRRLNFSRPIAEIVLQHHEKYNGSGYPAGLAGERILLQARILCVADVVEAMASHRPYRPSLGLEAALDEISKNSGILYDPAASNACVQLVKTEKFKFA